MNRVASVAVNRNKCLYAISLSSSPFSLPESGDGLV